MIKGGQRIATATGVMLADPNGLGNSLQNAAESLFDPAYWSARGELTEVSRGRGAAWFIGPAEHAWVLRHYRRGGVVARLSTDRYWWLGEDRVRAFAEWRLLDDLVRRGLHVPKPVAARYQRIGMTYRCDLIMQRIADTQTLSAVLALRPLPQDSWRAIGAAVAQMHAQGVDHADLNAHNILVKCDSQAALIDPMSVTDQVSVIDFDRARLRAPGAWESRNLHRLQRSLSKISARLPSGRFTPGDWNALLVGYRG